jgi:hypothetical protein
MLKFLGGVALSIMVLGMLGIKVNFEKEQNGIADKVTAGMTQAEVDDLIAIGVQRELITERIAEKRRQQASEVISATSEADRQKTVSEDPNASGGSVSAQDYYQTVAK